MGISSSKTKIADAKSAVAIDQEIAWLQITVDDVGSMHVANATKDLSDKVLVVGVGKCLA